MDKSIIVLFGSTGDLAKKKILPALSELYKKNLLNCPIACIGRRELEKEQYIKLMEINNNKFADNLYYVRTDFEDSLKFKKEIEKIKDKCQCRKIIFYLATSSELFVPIVEFINGASLINKSIFCFEKPFGSNLESAENIYNEILKHVKKENIYFADHYLGKDMVYNLQKIRESKELAGIWEKECAESLEINLIENFGIEGRGEYYDKTGAIKDVVQNHILQIIALLFSTRPIAKEKAEVINSLSIPLPKDIIIGQYEGYKSEKDVSPNSKTETFIAFKTSSHKSSIYVKTGKFLDKKATYFIIKSETHKIIINVYPEQNVLLDGKEIYRLNNKTTDYENIFLDLIKEEKNRFVSWHEIQASWEFTDKLIRQARKQKLHIYKKGSHGPNN